jgi:hypothetical protein
VCFEGNDRVDKKSEEKMRNDAVTPLEKKQKQRYQHENGLLRLVAYYQNLFDKEENLKYYSSEDYQNESRDFVKYHLKFRGM